MWQVLYPNLYVEPLRAVSQTYTVSIGDLQDVNSREYPPSYRSPMMIS